MRDAHLSELAAPSFEFYEIEMQNARRVGRTTFYKLYLYPRGEKQMRKVRRVDRASF
jgi:hypothetical protein